MPRKPRDWVAGGVYHVFARGNRREPIFLDDDDRRHYLATWGSVAEHLDWRCLAYCLMDNHVHHLVETPAPDLGVGVRLAHGAYGRHFNDTHTKSGHVFQGRFGATRAENPGVLWYFASYIALNPVRAKMCNLPEDYRWSSHAAVLGLVDSPRWLGVARLLALYGPDGPTALERYRQIVETMRVMGAAGFEPATSLACEAAGRGGVDGPFDRCLSGFSTAPHPCTDPM
jgi:putative transposase